MVVCTDGICLMSDHWTSPSFKLPQKSIAKPTEFLCVHLNAWLSHLPLLKHNSIVTVPHLSFVERTEQRVHDKKHVPPICGRKRAQALQDPTIGLHLCDFGTPMTETNDVVNSIHNLF